MDNAIVFLLVGVIAVSIAILFGLVTGAREATARLRADVARLSQGLTNERDYRRLMGQDHAAGLADLRAYLGVRYEAKRVPTNETVVTAKLVKISPVKTPKGANASDK